MVYFLVLQKTREIGWKETLKTIIFAGITWGIGYALIWGTKWIIVDVIYGKNLIKTVIEQFKFRSVGAQVKYSYIETVSRNLTLLLIIPWIYLIIVTIEAIVEIIVAKVKHVKLKQKLINALPYGIIALIPFAWYFVLKSHSYHHVFFTYRSLLLFCIGLPLMLQKITEKEKVEEVKNETIITHMLCTMQRILHRNAKK